MATVSNAHAPPSACPAARSDHHHTHEYEDAFCDLRNLPEDKVPIGFRHAKSGNIIPDDMSSGSHSARRLYFEVVGGSLVLLRSLGDDTDSDTYFSESSDDDDQSDQNKENEAAGYRLKCGRTYGVDIDGSQCDCMVCMGEEEESSDDQSDQNNNENDASASDYEDDDELDAAEPAAKRLKRGSIDGMSCAGEDDEDW